MTYTKTRKKAEQLRKAGYSYNLIANKTGVSKSTLSVWLTDLPYAPNAEVKRRIKKATLQAAKKQREKKLKSRSDAKLLARKDIGKMNKRDLFMLGLALYIGEGPKTVTVGMVNADVRVMKAAIRWFKECFDIKNEQFRLKIHLYPDNDIEVCLKYWENETGIPRDQFGKTQIDRRESKKMAKRGKLKYGTAHLNVLSLGNIQFGAFLRRRIRAQMDTALEQAGVV